ncbi:MAG: preprotein translocase subunit SecY [Ignisphaera sp.]
MGFMDVLAKIGLVVPSAPRPVRRPSLGKRLLFTGLAAIAFILLSATPLYGIQRVGVSPISPMISIVLAMASGTLAQLGIGPIVTSGLILQILVGAKIIDMDLNDPEDRRKFTLANKGLAIILAIVEAAGFVISGIFWYIPQAVSVWVKVAVFLQLLWGSIIIIVLDEAIQKGWGLGSGISLFILIGVAQRFFSELLAPHSISEEIAMPYGLIPYIVESARNGYISFYDMFIGRLFYGYPSLTGLIVTIVLIAVITYLSVARINIPIAVARYGGIRTKVPLQLMYVTNIPVLLTGILISNVLLILNLLRNYLGIDLVNVAGPYLSSPTLARFSVYPIQSMIYVALFLVLCIGFGILWIEIAGLNPEAQAENLIKAELNIPGMRRSTKILSSYLARYIYPLTIFSSIAVAVIALVGDIFGSFGTGTGLLLAVGILYNYYQILVYERTLEMYPLLKRFIGE